MSGRLRGDTDFMLCFGSREPAGLGRRQDGLGALVRSPGPDPGGRWLSVRAGEHLG